MELTAEFEAFRNELLLEAEASEVLQGAAFFDLYATSAIENGDIEHLEYCPAIFEGTPKFRIDGYSLNPEQGELSLAICDFRPSSDLSPLNASEAEAAFRQVDRFFERACDEKFINDLEDSSPMFQAAYLIYSNKAVIKRVRVSLFTNARTAIRKKMNTMREDAGIRFSYSILDFERYIAIQNARTGSEPIELNFEEHNLTPLRCLKASSDDDAYASYLVVLPGSVLGEIYGLFGARLLEANVRTFLQARTKVNKGIISTLKEEPENFFAFNNGLTATASDIEVENGKNGLTIKSVKNLQIVNGGQTTASLLYARDKEKSDLSEVFVQMKLSVVNDEKVEDLVPLISRYANTQNRISEADFFSSHPFHIHLEKISRRVAAPPKEGALAATKWFYERARGQYKDEQAYMTASARKRFQTEYPRDQMLVKTDFAKYEMSFLERPEIVSRGAQKCFLEFAKHIDRHWEPEAKEYGDGYFRNAMMRAMVFRWTDRMVLSSEWYKNNRAHKAQIVTYTLAALSSQLKKSQTELDYRKMWARQEVPETLGEYLGKLAPAISKIIQDPPSTTRNVAEYCKTQACWARVKGEVDDPVSELLSGCILSVTEAKEQKKDDKKTRKIDSGIDAQVKVMELRPRWPEIAKFGLDNRLFTPTEMNVVRIAIEKGMVSEKQAGIALGALAKAEDEGLRL